MQYPGPNPIDFFSPDKKTIHESKISRKQNNPYTDKLIAKINKYTRLYKNIPFVKAVYICDGISFNAATKDSDIDLFFIIEDGHIRRARLASVLFFWLLGIKRSFNHKAGKFDLIFYVTESHSNLQAMSLPHDPYLYHWLSHLIPLYTEDQKYSIYKQNKRIYNIFPNLPYNKHVVDLGLHTTHGQTKYKKVGEYLLGACIREKIISTLRGYSIKYRANKRKHKDQDIITTAYMLRFHKDIRSKIAQDMTNK